jgi:RING-like zinc finger
MTRNESERRPAIPKHSVVEESKQEIAGCVHIDYDSEVSKAESGSLSIPLPLPLVRLESCMTDLSEYTYDDDITGDNMCPICLCGFKQKDEVIVSKYCSHMFHKDCILDCT